MNLEALKNEFKRGETDYIDAIEALVRAGFNPKTAETMVEEWEDETKEEEKKS